MLMMPPDKPATALRAIVALWARVAMASFGGPAGQIAVMHKLVVEEKGWVNDKRFLQALNFCMLLPGPEAHQLAIYLGWLAHGLRGGLIAGLLFILPGVLVLMALSWLYVLHGDAPWLDAAFMGLKAAVLAIVMQAVGRLWRRAMTGRSLLVIAILALCAGLLKIPFPVIIIAAGLIGLGCAHFGLLGFDAPTDPADNAPAPASAKSLRRVWITCLALWLLPVIGLTLLAGPENLYTQIAGYFSGLAALSFGGAYAALAWMAQHMVESKGWLTAAQMLDGLGLAETTPGPLIIVTQFAGFMTLWSSTGSLAQASLGGLLTSWVIYAPSFLWIFLCAPYVERLSNIPQLAAALKAITAAVLGVMLNLAIWFALRYLFAAQITLPLGPLRLDMPDIATLNPVALTLTLLGLVACFILRLGLMPLLGLSLLAGLATLLIR